MFVNSLFERLDTVTLYFSYHSVWESVPYPNRWMKEGSVQCWCFSMRHGHSMIRHGWAGTSCSAGCVWIWQQCLEISRTVTGVHFIKHCDIRRDSIIYEVKTIRPLSLPVPIPAQRARKPSQMQQKTNSSHLPPPAGPTGVHPDAVPLILTIPQEYTQQIQARRGEGGWEQKADGWFLLRR